MASQLVYVDGEALRVLRPGRPRGARVLIRGVDLPPAVVDRLDGESTLFAVTIEGDAVIAVAVLDDARIVRGVVQAQMTVIDQDMTRLLPRLGCRDLDEIHSWANTPRIVDASDQDLLRFELRIGIESLPEPPEDLVDDDRARELRADVWRDPDSDIARAIYADYLQDRGDPRGELIALQLARVAGATPSDRETYLVNNYADACIEPLGPYLRSHLTRLRRGFLAVCGTDDRVALPPEIAMHPAWSTVESIETTNRELLAGGALIAARRLATELDLAALSGSALPFERLVGPCARTSSGRLVSTGIRIVDGNVRDRATTHTGTLGDLPRLMPRLRLLSIAPVWLDRFENATTSSVVERLSRLDIVTGSFSSGIAELRAVFDQCPRLQTLSIRFEIPDIRDEIIALSRRAGTPRMIVEVHTPGPHDELAQAIALASRGIVDAELRDLGAPSQIAERQRALIRRIEPLFQTITLVQTPVASLAP